MSQLTLRRYAACLAAALAVAILPSCRKHKGDMPDFNAISGQEMPMLLAFQQLHADAQEWTDAYMPVTLSLLAPEEASLSGRATLVNGSALHISLRAVGAEVAVIYLDADSAFIVDKYHHRYVAEAIADVFGNYGLSLIDFQSLFLGLPCMPAPAQNLCIATVASDPEHLESATFLSDGRVRSRCIYARPHATPAGVCSEVGSLLLLNREGNGLVAQAILNLDEAKWDTGRSPRFRPPQGYEKIDVASLAQIFADM